MAFFPYIATPFLFAYQADFAYGTKAERLNIEMQNIVRNESHWFNDPLILPKYLEQYYREMQDDANTKLNLIGEPAEPEWAVFTNAPSGEELLKRSTPISRLLHGVLA